MSSFWRSIRRRQTNPKIKVEEDSNNVELLAWTIIEKEAVSEAIKLKFKEKDVMAAVGYLKMSGKSVNEKELLNKLKEITKFNEPTKEDCVICFDGKIEYAFIPCGHFGFCSSCIEFMKTVCPICSAKIKQPIKIFSINLS